MASSAYLDWVLKRENKAPRRPQPSISEQELDVDKSAVTTVPVRTQSSPVGMTYTLHKTSVSNNAKPTIEITPSGKTEKLLSTSTDKSPIVRKRKLSELLGRSPATHKQQRPASPPSDLDLLSKDIVKPTEAINASNGDYPLDAVAPFDFDANAEELERAVKRYRIQPSDTEMELSFQSPVRPKRKTSAAVTPPRTPLMQDVQYWKAVERFADMD